MIRVYRHAVVDKTCKRMIALMLSCVLLFGLIFNMDFQKKVYGDDLGQGYVIAGVDGLRIRTSTDTSNTDNVITHVSSGFIFDVIEKVDDWYHIRFDYDGQTREGYIYADYVKLKKTFTYEENMDFEAYLDSQDFPESYRPALRELHAMYPNWIFVADMIGTDFEEVVDNENVQGRSLIYGSADSSWKSTDSYAYNPETDSYYEQDSGGWVQASRGLIRYALDPRNFLDETRIFMFEELAYDPDIHNLEGVENVIAGSFMEDSSHNLTLNGESYNYASALLYAGQYSGVSPYHLASRIIQEQGNSGYGSSISGNVYGYEGYYNYYNQGAVKTSSGSAVVNGLRYASQYDDDTLRPWNNRMKSIVGGAYTIGSQYIRRGQDTIYYEKFDVKSYSPYWHQYMTNVLAARSESYSAAKAYSDEIKETTPLVFSIPVYDNMSDSPYEAPVGDGSPSNILESLQVSDYDLTPSFDPYTSDYELIVASDVDSVSIDANAYVSSADIYGLGDVGLDYGQNDFSVTVRAENGDERTYNLLIVREGEPADEPAPEPESEARWDSNYDYDASYISGLEVGTDVEDFKNNFSTENASIEVIDSDGNEKSGLMKTGDIVRILDESGNLADSKTVIIYGDINGDGEVDIMDLIYLRRHLLNIEAISGNGAKAADISRADGIDIMDLIYLRRDLLGIDRINQR